MRVALCGNLQTISQLWQNHLDEAQHKAKIIKDESELIKFLSKHQKAVVCLELEWLTTTLQEFIVSIQNSFPKTRIFILSQEPNFHEGMELLQLGVQGYGNARMQPVHFKDALKIVKQGNNWLYPEFIQMMIQNINVTQESKNLIEEKLKPLTKREREVAKLIQDGHTNQEIADITSITLRTVKAHTSSIYEKMNVKDRVALVLHLNETV